MAGPKQTGPLEIDAVLAKVKRLKQSRSYRDRKQQFFVEGVRHCIQAIDHKLKISVLLYSEKLLTVIPARQRVRQARRSGIPTIKVTPEQFRQISTAERASGIGAVVHQHWSNLPQVRPHADLCWVVLEQVRSPGNLGSLIRTSEAVGGAGFILLGQDIDPFNPHVVRASMGSLLKQRFVRTHQQELYRWIKRHDCQGVGVSPEGGLELHQSSYTPPVLLFLGEERKGLTQSQRKLCDRFVRIPMVGEIDSLNLAVAGSLMMYEVFRYPRISRQPALTRRNAGA